MERDNSSSLTQLLVLIEFYITAISNAFNLHSTLFAVAWSRQDAAMTSRLG